MDYRKVIESRYNRQNWLALLNDIFGNSATLRQTPVQIESDNQLVDKALYMGKITLSDGYELAVYEVQLKDNVQIEHNRVGIRNLLCTHWKQNGYTGAFMFCYRQDDAVLRFSYVSEAWQFNEKGEFQKNSTDTKRFTYLLGEGHRSRTAIKQFEELRDSKLDLKAITKAFSVEALSDMFFKEYKKNYEDIIEYITGKRMVKVANKWEEQVTGQPCREIMLEFSKFPDAEKAVRDYVKKLMGRLVFIQFLQKKGWMGCTSKDWNDGEKEFVQNLFAKSPYKDTFVDDVLEPLFDDINNKREGDLAGAWINNFPLGGMRGAKVPYLNGGLFENDDYDKTNFPLPAKYMKQMLDFFASYNFTIDENDPDDAEIGVDPEMLGRIFENLLEDNKDKGAFYTPKEIVQYMCRESLIAYLQTNVEDEATKELIRQFVTTHKASLLSEEWKTKVDQKLKDVKICDPAIGSGAFPMGLLRELYACRRAVEGLSDEKVVEIKTHIIQQNIYGVDIEKGAVDIARLRFWLALIVDEKTPHPLPNFDYKIMQGNSLISTFCGEYIDLSTDDNHTSGNIYKMREEKIKLYNLKKQYYTAYGDQKYQLAIDIKDSILQLIALQMDSELRTWHQHHCEIQQDLFGEKIPFNEIKSQLPADKQRIVDTGAEIRRQLHDTSKSLHERAQTDIHFFDWHIMFTEVFDVKDAKGKFDGGFDIVIGNPPYISAPAQIANDILAKQREDIIASKLYDSLYQKWDLYIPFIEHGIQLARDKGIITMIVPYPLTNQTYGKKLREMIVSDYDMFELCDLNGTKIFENATVSNCIPFIRKAKSETVQTTISHIKDKRIISKDYIKSEDDLVPDKKTSVWNVGEEKRDTNRHAGLHVLGDFCYISKGMVLNADEKTAKGDFKKEDLISLTEDEIHCRKYIEAKDIEKYEIKRVRYLEYNTDRCPGKLSRPTFPELYNNEKLLTNKIGDVKAIVDYDNYLCDQTNRICILWHHLRGVVNKSILSSIKKFSTLTRTEMEELSQNIDIRYLLAILNTPYANVLLTNIRGVGNIDVNPEYLRNIPIPNASKEQQQPIIYLVNHILSAKKLNPHSDTTALETQIDRLVYELYGLTNAEVKIIDPEAQVTGNDNDLFKA